MANEDRARSAAPHSLTLDERERLAVSGVEEVVSFDEDAVTIQTVRGRLLVRGSKLRVEQLEKGTGQLRLTGLVTELCYEDAGPSSGFFQKLFR